MTIHPPDEKAIFIAARQLGSPESRRAYIAQACGQDADLRARIEALISVFEADKAFLESPAEAVRGAFSDPIGEAPGSVIGPYKLLEQIGQGGFGVVFLAEQQQPIHRQVALKVIKPGMDTRQVIARFEAERQALALMDHPNIARVLDAGQTPAAYTGGSPRPYFVMEVARGAPITEYCDQERLPLSQRLDLFVHACQGIQHAHQKGIVHRDIKPSNVLVTLHDGAPVVKIIDFGVAKAIDRKLTDNALATQFPVMVGTPLYMSPEQAEMSGLDIDTRADIYALGVLLYELLTGTTPFDRARLETIGIDEVRRIIREEEPLKPSTRIDALSDTVVSVTSKRRSDPRRLRRSLRGDLDWIVMKCLEKDRTRRYETANALACDIQQYLNEEPVQAGPPSASYKLHKFARKHRKLLVATATFALLLSVAAVVSTWLAIRATMAERATERERDKAIAEKERANIEAAIATAINDFLQRDLLGQSDVASQPAGHKRNPNVTVRELLDRASQRIDERFQGQELTESAIRLTIGKSYIKLGEYAEARKHVERSLALRKEKLGEKHRDTLESWDALASLASLRGRYDEAQASFNQILEARRETLGNAHADTLMSLNNLATAYFLGSRYQKAEELYKQILDGHRARFGDDNPLTLKAMNNLGMVYGSTGRHAEAEPLLTQAVEGLRAHFGEDHPEAFMSVNNLGVLYRESGRYNQAERLFKDVLEAARVRARDHPETLRSRLNLATIYRLRRQYDQAEPMLQEVVKDCRIKLEADHPQLLESIHELAVVYLETNRFGQAEPLLREALKASSATLGESHYLTLHLMNGLAQVCDWRGDFEEAERIFTKVLELRRATLRPGHPDTLLSMNNLATYYRVRKLFDKARPLFIEAVVGARKSLGSEHPLTQQLIENLAYNHLNQGSPHLAEPLFRELTAIARKDAGPDSPAYASQQVRLAGILMMQKKYRDAEAVVREALAIRVNKEPDDWPTFDTRSLLGGALLGQKKYADAEKLLLDGYRGMKKRESKIPAAWRNRLCQAVERLVQLYDAWGKKAEADEWRKELEECGAKQKVPALSSW